MRTNTTLPACLVTLALLVPSCGASQEQDHAANRVAATAKSDRATESKTRSALALSEPAAAMPAAAGEDYASIAENAFDVVADSPLSTFAVDVDTASYSNVRRFLRDGSLPPNGAVRIEEMINYFDYDYEQPTGSDPFSVQTEVSDCPWAQGNKLVHIGLQGKSIDPGEMPSRNLVFLLDVSGSMNSPDKLPLLKAAFKLMVGQLGQDDRVSIVVYAGASGMVLPPTAGSDRGQILAAFDQLEAGGSTNGADGIELAYALARDSFIEGGMNRVILATDGDFNVGVTDQDALTKLIEQERESGVYLSVFGFGTGNLKDSTMEMLADKGNGNYGYIDTLAEARKLLVEQVGGTLVTIAKDVKVQVEFNPAKVASYRLLGYENRLMAAEDFDDDTKDAGEIGAGHTVTALYEVVPAGAAVVGAKVKPSGSTMADDELASIKLRYQQPDGDGQSTLLAMPVPVGDIALAATSDNFRFSAAVAEFGMLLRNSEHRGTATFDSARKLATGAVGQDAHGHRGELVELIDRARSLSAAVQ